MLVRPGSGRQPSNAFVVYLRRPCTAQRNLLVSYGDPKTDVPGSPSLCPALRRSPMNSVSSPTNLGVLLQRYFVERLMQQLNASTRTIAAYRDCFKLLLSFLKIEVKKRPTDVNLQDLTAPRILKFLNYLERERHNSIR